MGALEAGSGSVPARHGSGTVDVAEGRGAFDALRAEWDALLARGPADLPFLTHGWTAAWLDAKERALEALRMLVQAEGHLHADAAPEHIP